MSKPGHNSGKGGPIDPAKLKSYVERIEAVEAEEADHKAAKKDIYVEVKAAGMRPKMVRKIVKERKKTEADAEDEAELELYRAALAMPGATYRSVSAKTGIPKSTLQRLVPRNKNGTSAPKPEDGDDGITESCGPCPVSPAEGAGKGNGLPSAKGNAEDSPAARRHTSDDALAPALGISQCADDAAPGPHDPNADEAPATPSVGAVASPEGERVASSSDDDDLTIPAHLRGPSPANRRAA